MTRKELVAMRDDVFADVLKRGKHLIDGGEVKAGAASKFTYLVMLHGVLCTQLKHWEEGRAHAHAVCQLDEVLGILTDVRFGEKPSEEWLDKIRAKIHDVLAYLES
jgi:hypothetical protein